MYSQFIKPLFDTVTAFSILLLCSPLLVGCMLLLAITNRGKVWFIQQRPGKNERLFNVIKFRTMDDNLDEEGKALPDELRLTWMGKFMRKTSLDELPQLFNVLKGEMSIVGPRPLLAEYLPLYTPHQKKRHNVKPGITGWAQVNGRNAISWKQKFELDAWYVDHLSFWIDIKILLLTLVKVLKAEGISSETSATMEKFRGNN